MKVRIERDAVRFLCMAIVVAPLAPVLGGCVGMAVGAGATVATAASEERGVSGAANDLAIAANINALWIKYDSELVSNLDVTVSEGRALLTGTVPTQQRRLEAVRLAWRSKGVRTVISEIQVRESGGIASYARDGWITAKLVSRLSFDRDVDYINYTVETVNGVVYVMGIAQNQAELNRVKAHARHVPYVRRVVSHVRLKHAPRENAGNPMAGTKR